MKNEKYPCWIAFGTNEVDILNGSCSRFLCTAFKDAVKCSWGSYSSLFMFLIFRLDEKDKSKWVIEKDQWLEGTRSFVFHPSSCTHFSFCLWSSLSILDIFPHFPIYSRILTALFVASLLRKLHVPLLVSYQWGDPLGSQALPFESVNRKLEIGWTRRAKDRKTRTRSKPLKEVLHLHVFECTISHWEHWKRVGKLFWAVFQSPDGLLTDHVSLWIFWSFKWF